MYHEMLHKKHKFTSSKSGRRLHHSKAFREEESRFDDFKEIDIELKRYLRNYNNKIKKRKSIFQLL